MSADLRGRILVAVPLGIFAVAIVAAGGGVFAAGLVLLGLLMLHELYTMLAYTRPVKLGGFLALFGFALAGLWAGLDQVVLVAVCALPVVFLLAAGAEGLQDLTPSIAVTLLGVYWIGLAIGQIVLLRGLPHGGGIVLDILLGTFIADTGAYVGGRLFGRRPLAPRLSPNKTVEGLVFGVAGAAAAVWCAGLYQDWLGGWDALLLGLVVGLAAPLGDLFESKVKRDAGAKDAGTLFGAHGGALDRLDAALFTLVAGYYLWFALL
jgi:phosphatidate cytidylyltransferase